MTKTGRHLMRSDNSRPFGAGSTCGQEVCDANGGVVSAKSDIELLDRVERGLKADEGEPVLGLLFRKGRMFWL
ncbi:hypothetical protein BDW67DRAFT_161102, partial [Aspergillus spinulosporus]